MTTQKQNLISQTLHVMISIFLEPCNQFGDKQAVTYDSPHIKIATDFMLSGKPLPSIKSLSSTLLLLPDSQESGACFFAGFPRVCPMQSTRVERGCGVTSQWLPSGGHSGWYCSASPC